jgi:hypothetical protein
VNIQGCIDTGTFSRVPVLVYNTQNYGVFGLCPSSGILENTVFQKLTLSVLLPLEHQMIDEVRKPSNPKGIDAVILRDVVVLRKYTAL